MPPRSPYRLGIVGAGPSCTYVLERLASHLSNGHLIPLSIYVFDPSAQFGAGSVHSPSQSPTSPLNRIAGQIGFGADESSLHARNLLPPALRPDFVTWCRERYACTGDERFLVSPEGWPKRFLHGLALRDTFERYVGILRGLPDVAVHLRPMCVIGLEIHEDGVHLKATGPGDPTIVVDHVLLATGHTSARILEGTQYDRLRSEAARRPCFHYVYNPYPMEQALGEFVLTPDTVIGCRGMGLTAFDVSLYLTEGRGGAFVREPGGALTYHRSGHEPHLVLFSRSGMFTSTRPHNAKEVDISRLEHRGIFFTPEIVDRLRQNRGCPIEVPRFGPQRQLDFEADVLPIIVLEMQYVHYRTLFGEAFGERFRQRGTHWLNQFLALEFHAPSAGEALMTSSDIEALVNEAMLVVTAAITGASATELLTYNVDLPTTEILYHYFSIILGEAIGENVRSVLAQGGRPADVLSGKRSPFGHSIHPAAHRFDWEKLIAPLAPEDMTTPEIWKQAVIDYLRYDIKQAMQDNLRNPTKAACDGVWRDLRQTLGYVVDHGGLTAASHRLFLEKYLPIHNRLANGTSIEVMEQMLALLEACVIDVGAGPLADVRLDESGVHVVGPLTGFTRRVDVFIEARVHPFDVRHADSALYVDLLKRGYVRPWMNPSATGEPYIPGGIDITIDHHPVSRDGRILRELTCLGVPTEGRLFYQIGAARPRQNHHIINDVIRWLDAFLACIPPKSVID